MNRCLKDKPALRHSQSTVSSVIAFQAITVRLCSQGLSTVFSTNLPIRTLPFADPPYDICLFEITSVGSKLKIIIKKTLQEKGLVEVRFLGRKVEMSTMTWGPGQTSPLPEKSDGSLFLPVTQGEGFPSSAK